jgi:Phage tail tube protein
MARVGGIIQFQVQGEIYSAKGNFTYNLGRPKREAVVGSSDIPGYKETPQVAFVEGEITDRGDLDLKRLVDTVDATITLQLATGKVISLRDAFYAGEGTGNTDEGNIGVRFEAADAQEVRA